MLTWTDCSFTAVRLGASHHIDVLTKELGLGEDNGKSATKPTELESLRGVEVIEWAPLGFCWVITKDSVAAGAFFTLFLAKPSGALSDIPRHPEHVDSASICVECNVDRGEDDPPMECEKVCIRDVSLIVTKSSAMSRTIYNALIRP